MTSSQVHLRDLQSFLRKGDGPILLEGPTGTGKTQTAYRIHQLTRPGKPFRVVNCAALQSNEREALFRGVRKEAFTKVRASESVFVEHDGGTVLLDDFQSCDESNQTTLLDLLTESSSEVEGYRCGDTSERCWRADVQVILAVNEPVEKLVDAKRLRRDLLARIPWRFDPLPGLRDRIASDPDQEKQRDYLRLFLLEMQERSVRLRDRRLVGGAGALDPHNRFFDTLLLSEEPDGSLSPRLGYPYPFRDNMPIPDALLDYEWPENFRELEAVARELYETQGKLGCWSEEGLIAVFRKRTRVRGSAPDHRGAESTADDFSSARPGRLLALAHLRAVQRSRSLSDAAEELLLDPRTLARVLTAAIDRTEAEGRRQRRGRSEKLLSFLSDAERRSLAETATTLLRPRAERHPDKK